MLRRLLAFLGAILAFVLLAWLVQRMRGQPGIPDYYEEAGGRRVGVLISRTEIGLVPRPGVDAGQAAASVTAFGLTRMQIPDSSLLVFSLPEPRDRNGLAQLARAIAAQRSNLIAHVGLVVRIRANGNPVLAASEIIVRLQPGRTAAELQTFNASLGAEILMENPFTAGDFLLRLLPGANLDSLAAAQRYLASGLVAFAFPNFINSVKDLQPQTRDGEPAARDPLLAAQWPHQNTGQTNAAGEPGAMDADADTVEAWGITQGAAATIIAIIESGGFETTHPDLAANALPGWNFEPCAFLGSGAEGANGELRCGDTAVGPAVNDAHGTAVAGIAAAQGGNGIGVSGVCPRCSWMPLRIGRTDSDFVTGLAVDYAVRNGAQIINNSWEMEVAPLTKEKIQAAASMGRGGLGTLIVFAAGNTVVDRCWNSNLLHTLPSVIAVSSSTNLDRKVDMADSGDCVDVLAPSDRGQRENDPLGTLNIATTDLSGTPGFNSASPLPGRACPSVESTEQGYTQCFLGTSAAAPFVAGVAGLVLTARPSLAREQVQRLLQDTADKIEPGEADYSPVNGFSQGKGTPTHAYGRVNAFEAVRIVAAGQKNGVDVFVRDNDLDWGNTGYEPVRNASPNGGSPDIKIDAPPLRAAAPANSAAFESFATERPKAGAMNRVYVRLRNRGPDPSGVVTVKLLWAPAANPLPELPEGFWTAFPGNASAPSAWTPVGVQTIASVPYSGSSLAGGALDAAQILSFDAALPAGLTGKISFLAILHAPPQDPAAQNGLVPETLASGDNNVTFRNARLRRARK
jgi:hypothetical protein